MTDSPRFLLQNQAADGSGAAVDWRGGHGSFRAWGPFGDGTVALQASFDSGTTFIDVEGASLTAAGVRNFRLPVCRLRATLSGASGSPSASVTAEV